MAEARPENLLAGDLEEVLEAVGENWEELRGARIFVTGGTGFFGKWLLESLAWADRRRDLGLRATILTRDPEAFRAAQPALAAHAGFEFVRGDVRDFPFPEGAFSHLIHAATEASAALNREQPRLMFETVVEGTRRVLDFAAQAGVGKLLLTSSGAVYGPQPSQMTHVPEDYPGAPDPLAPGSAYGEGKRASELLCGLAANEKLEVKIARCYAFVGPHLPLDIHFAVGNFIRDGLAGREISIGGDGTPRRSYLYMSDLAAWLWTILLKGAPSRAYHVGSEEDASIREVAESVAKAFDPAPAVRVARIPDPAVPPARYVPSTRRAREELGLAQRIGFAEALARTVRWNRLKPSL